MPPFLIRCIRRPPAGPATAAERLADLPQGSGIDATAASRAMIWRRPRWSARLQPEPVTHLLEEAHALGIVGRGAITTPARALLDRRQLPRVAAMAKVLPAPIDHFLVQADLTVVVPGPLDRDLADELAAVADVESAGAAMVYRVSEPSIRQRWTRPHRGRAARILR